MYSGADYRAAVQAAVDAISSGQRVSVIASGSIGANTITITSGKTFEVCGTMNVANRSGRGAIEVTDASGVQVGDKSQRILRMCLMAYRSPT